MGCTFLDGDSLSSSIHLRLLFSFKARVLAVLDWELSTTGHPLADLAYATLFYFWPVSVKDLSQGTVLNFKDILGTKLIFFVEINSRVDLYLICYLYKQ